MSAISPRISFLASKTVSMKEKSSVRMTCTYALVRLENYSGWYSEFYHQIIVSG